jgi:hypothetical protein
MIKTFTKSVFLLSLLGFQMLTSEIKSQCAYPVPSVTGTTSLSCGQTTTLSASGSGPIFRWYDAATGGNLLHTGSTYATGVLTTTDTIYVENIQVTNASQTFNYTGSVQSFTVPAGVTAIQYDVRGARGGSSSWGNGGLGGRVTGTLSVTPGQTLSIYVGQSPSSWTGGWNGGGSVNTSTSNARGGGGASDIRIGGTALANRVVVAGGGGGGGRNSSSSGQHGGAGGGLIAGNGFYNNSNNTSYHGHGGTQTAGGAGAGNGTLGNGGTGTHSSSTRTGGGGGGGYFGGGGASSRGGGGGGSSFTDNLSSNVVHSQGFQSGNGQILLNWSAVSCSSPRIPVALDVDTNVVAPTVSGVTSIICGQTTQLTATATGGSIRWYADAGAANEVGTASLFTTPALTATDTFYTRKVTSSSGSQTFNFTGNFQSFTVPAGVTNLTVDVRGAKGGNANGGSWAQGGNGGRLQATLPVTPGQTLYMYVGGMGANGNSSQSWKTGGWNGGGDGWQYGGGGGGASDIRTQQSDLNSRLIVAGGGGGGGYISTTSTTANRGGRGGGTTGEHGFYNSSNTNTCYSGRGGNPSSGGTRGTCGNGQDGAFGVGGVSTNQCCSWGSGGGGGGWYGGGGAYFSGGGGGSSYAHPTATNVTHSQGTQSSNGQIIISWNAEICASPLTPAIVTVNDTVALPTVSGTTVTCGFPANITASGAYGHFRWYDQAVGGNLLSTDTTFTTPNLFNQNTFYVEATSVANAPYCVSQRVAVQIAVDSVQPPLLANDTVVCGNPITFTATGSTGMFNWYTQPTGGVPFDTAAAQTVTPLQTTTYYVEATSNNNPSGSQTFTFSGNYQTFTVPAGVFQIQVDARGARGGFAENNSWARGGYGGRMVATVPVTPGQTLYVYPGGIGTNGNSSSSWKNGGWNGGGNGYLRGGGGGGASDVRTQIGNLNSRLIVAGGGGGGGYRTSTNSTNERGGAGGGTTAEAGFYSNSNTNASWGGRGGTQTTGGNQGTSGNGSSGSFGVGGQSSSFCCTYGSGGGGGGWYGGGGAYYAGGGGGSSYAIPSATIQTNTQGFQNGAGEVIISWNVQTCSSNRIPVQAVIENLPQPTVADDTVTCASSATLMASGSSGFYNWYTQASGGSAFAQGPVLSTAPIFQPETLYVEAYDPNNTCLSQRVPVHVTIDSLPAPQVAGHDSLCDSGSTIFTASGNTGSGGYVWYDSPGGQSVQSGATYSTGTQTTPLTRYVRYEVGNCFSPYTAGVLLITPTPDATISAPDSLCSGEGVQFFTAGTMGGQWSGTGISSATAGSFDPAVASLGSNQVIYNINQNGCSDADTITVIVSQGPVATIADPGSLCQDASPLTLSSQTPGGTWSGSGVTDASLGTFDPAQAIAGTNAIAYSVSASGCTSVDTLQLTVFGLPDAGLLSVGALCSDAGIVNLSPNVSGGTFSGPGVISATLGQFDPTVSLAGNHTVVYSRTENGCQSSDSIVITVNQAPNATITAPSFCVPTKTLWPCRLKAEGEHGLAQEL